MKEGKILLMKRKNTLLYNRTWSIPGGKVEEHETIEEAVKRELLEEIGVKVRIIRKLCDYIEKKDEKITGIFSGYLVEIIEGKPKIMEPHKASELKYFSMDEIPKNLAPYTKAYIETYLESTTL